MMKSLLTAAVFAGMLAAPAMAEPATKTAMFDKDGKQVDSLLLRYAYDASWKLNSSNFLLRNEKLEYVLVTFKEPCDELDFDRSVNFVPALQGRIYSSLPYEARDAVKQQPYCDIASVRMVKGRDEARAIAGK